LEFSYFNLSPLAFGQYPKWTHSPIKRSFSQLFPIYFFQFFGSFALLLNSFPNFKYPTNIQLHFKIFKNFLNFSKTTKFVFKKDYNPIVDFFSLNFKRGN